MLSETEGNVRLIYYFRGNVFFLGKDCFNKVGGCGCYGIFFFVGNLVIFFSEDLVLGFVV